MSSIAIRPKQKQPLIYVPATFVPQAVLPPELHRYADCARYMLHLILVRSAMRKADKRGFVRLSAAYLRKMIPKQQVVPLRAALEQAGVIEIDRQYIRGEKSMGYKLTPPHRQQRVRKCRVTDRRLAERLREHRRRRQAQFAPQSDIHRYLHRWLDRIDIDLPAAMRTIANTPRMAEFAANYQTLVELIAQRDWRDHFCQWGRFHSPITRLHRRLRRHLTIDRKPLVNIDVANSQPLLLAKLAIDRHYPAIGQFIRRIKADHYETLSRTLQSIESEIVIQGACRRLMTHHPDTPVITIHDSIMTTPDHIETVKHAMLAAFAEHNVKPTLRVEPV